MKLLLGDTLKKAAAIKMMSQPKSTATLVAYLTGDPKKTSRARLHIFP